jgi:RNA polymerase sigma factor (sigma-70 family)
MSIETEADYTRLYQANYEDLLRFVRRRAHPLNVDDIVAETFLAAWRRRRELPDEPRPWLFRTARNAMLNSHRAGNRQQAVAVRIAGSNSLGTYDPIGSPPDSMRDIDGHLDLVSAWRSLSPAEQEVLALSIWEDLSAKDAAAVLGCSRAAYAMRLTRAKRQLRARLEHPEPAPAPLAAIH